MSTVVRSAFAKTFVTRPFIAQFWQVVKRFGKLELCDGATRANKISRS